MKHLTFAVMAIAVLVSSLTAQTKQKAEPKGPDAKIETVVINVPTVVCSSCDATITKAVRKAAGVKTVKVNLEKKTATVSFASGKTTLANLEKAISNAGYDANNTKRNPAAYEKLDACCKKD
jgi:copper chaperone CopZ